MLTLKDLKQQGLTLTKEEAIELQPIISHIAQRGADVNLVYEVAIEQSEDSYDSSHQEQALAPKKKATKPKE